MPTSSELQAIRSELDALKAQNRRLRWLVSIAIVAIFAALLTGMVGPQDEKIERKVMKAHQVETKRLVVQDPAGRERIVIETKSGHGPVLCINDADGNPRAVMSYYERKDQPYVSVTPATGEGGVTLGDELEGSYVRVDDRKGQERAKLAWWREADSSFVMVFDRREHERAILACSNGTAYIRMKDEKEREGVLIGTDEKGSVIEALGPISRRASLRCERDGSVGLRVTDKNGTIRAGAGVSKQGAGYFSISDNTGRKTWETTSDQEENKPKVPEEERAERSDVGDSKGHEHGKPPSIAPSDSHAAAPVASLHGVVLNAEGKPEAGAIIRLECENTDSGNFRPVSFAGMSEALRDMIRFAMTDGQGRYSVENLKPGRRVTAEVFLIQESFWAACKNITYPSPDGNYVLALPQSVAKQIAPGRVLPEDLLLFIFSHGGSGVAAPTEVRPVQPHTKPVFQTETALILAAGERRQFDVHLRGYCTVCGHVRDQDGSPQSGLKVCLQRLEADPRTLPTSGPIAEAITGDDGAFRLEGVPGGRWMVSVFPPDPFAVPPAFAFPMTSSEFPGAGQEMKLDLRVYRGLSIEGRLIVPKELQGEGMVAISALHAGQLYWTAAEVRRDGTFCISPLVPGQYWLSSMIQGALLSPALTDRPVNAGAHDVALRLDVSAPVAGRVVDHSGHVRSGHLLVVSEARGTQSRVELQQDGRFQIKYLEPGRYTLFALSEDGQMGVAAGIEAAPGAARDQIVIRLEPAGFLQLKVVGPQEQYPVQIISRHWQTRLVPHAVRAGVWQKVIAPAGPLEVRVLAAAVPEAAVLGTESVTVEAGTEVRAEIPVER